MNVIVVVAALVAFYGYATVKARRIVRRRARDLAAATGLDAASIEAETRVRYMTPGDWACEHGLDPITFRPRGAP